MKSIILLALLMAVVLADDKLDDLFNDLNVEELVSNHRLLKGYARCFLENGPCTPQGRKVKAIIPLVLQTKCKVCSSAQKHDAAIVLRVAREHVPEEYNTLYKKYDPKNEHLDEVNAFLTEN